MWGPFLQAARYLLAHFDIDQRWLLKRFGPPHTKHLCFRIIATKRLASTAFKLTRFYATTLTLGTDLLKIFIVAYTPEHSCFGNLRPRTHDADYLFGYQNFPSHSCTLHLRFTEMWIQQTYYG